MNHFFPSCLLACAVLTLGAHATSLPQPEQAHLGLVKVGSSATVPVTVTFPSAATLGSILVQPGAAAATQEFSSAIGGTCVLGKAYAENDTCSLRVTFKPVYAGKRYGSVQLLDTSGNLIALDWLRGTGVAPQISFMPGNEISLDTFPDVKGLAIDGNNSVYLALGSFLTPYGDSIQGGEASLTENADGSYAYKGESTWVSPTGVWSDLAGNTYLYDLALGLWESGSNTGPILGSMQPTAIAGDPFGNLYLIQSGSNTILKEALQPSTFPQDSTYVQSTVFASNSTGFQAPFGVWMDFSGNLYIADIGFLYKWSLQSDGSFTETYKTDLVGKLAVDGTGNLYGFAQTDNLFYKETLQPDGSYLRAKVASTIANPIGLAADSIGNLYYADSYQGNYESVTKEDFTQAPTLVFGNTPLGAISISQAVTISNSGTAPLTFSSIVFPADFLEDRARGECNVAINLEPGKSCTLTASFAPIASLPSGDTSAPLSESITIVTNTLNAEATQQAITLTGSEMPAAPPFRCQACIRPIRVGPEDGHN